jgi:hypothetical protein
VVTSQSRTAYRDPVSGSNERNFSNLNSACMRSRIWETKVVKRINRRETFGVRLLKERSRLASTKKNTMISAQLLQKQNPIE